jgi:hypothetical protein
LENDKDMRSERDSGELYTGAVDLALQVSDIIRAEYRCPCSRTEPILRENYEVI